MRRILIILLFVVLFLGCFHKTNDITKDEDAFTLFDKGKYDLALDKFLVLRYETSGIEKGRVIYYTGLIYYKKKNWHEAISSFKELLENYPTIGDSILEPAAYMMGVAYFKIAPKAGRDISAIDNSIDGLSYYIQMFPKGPHFNEIWDLREKLIERESRYKLSTGDFYFNRREYEAAKVVYETILEENPDFPLEDELLYKIAVCYLKEGERDIAENYFNKIDEDSKYYRKLEKYFK